MRLTTRRMMFGAGLAVVAAGLAIPLRGAPPPQPPAQPAWVVGDVFVAVGSGKYEVRSSTGALKQTITVTLTNPKKATAGCWFDSQFSLYTTDFTNTKVIKHDLASPHAQSLFADVALNAPDGHSESIVMAVNGDVYVGNAGNANGTGTRNIVKYSSSGTFLASYSPAVENRGIDWMDLATDQKTMFYTSEGRSIKRFDVGATPGQLGDFATLPGSTPANRAFAIRLLPPFDGSGGLLVADNANIKRLDSSGNVVSTYDATNENSWQALNLDPDGSHFWAGGFTSGKLYRFPIGTPATPPDPPTTYGSDAGPFQTDGSGKLQGICVMGEAQLQVRPLQLSNSSGSTQLVDITVPFGDPAATGDTDTYSFNTWRLRIHVKANQTVVAAVSFTPQSTTFGCNPLDPNDFDCRFTQTPAQCVPFFQDPSKPYTGDGSADPYRCAYYRVKDMPACSASNPSACPFDEPFIGSDSVAGELIVNMTNPPSTVFDISAYGVSPEGAKGNPRIMRAPGSQFQFTLDATTAVIDWPAMGSGTPNDYAAAMRTLDNPGSCAQIIMPDKTELLSGSSTKIVVQVKTGPVVNGECTGDGIAGATSNGNKITLAIAGTGTNSTLVIFCGTPGNSLGCFTEDGAVGRYQSTFSLDPTVIPIDLVNPYIFAVTSVNDPTVTQQNSGIFPPTSRQYKICPAGGC